MTKRPSVIVILIDTLRADHLSCYGYPYRTSSFIDQLTDRSILFQNAVAPAPWTFPVHASLFTGRYPTEHGATNQHLKLEPSLPTLAELLSGAGYRTAGFSNNAWVGRATGLARGFQYFEEIPSSLPRVARGKQLFIRLAKKLRQLGLRRVRRAEKTFGNVLLWIEDHLSRHGDHPFFVFVNLMEVHAPYLPPVQFAKPFLPSGVRSRDAYQVDQNMDKYNAGVLPINDYTLGVLEALYNGEIAYMDNQIRRFCRELECVGLLEETLLIITSDHGENLGDHGLMEHQYCLYDTLLHVPLILHWPAASLGGRVVQGQVPVLHLFDTVLDLSQVEWPCAPTGRPYSLLDRLDGRGDTAPILAEYSESVIQVRRLRKHVPDFDDPWMLTDMRCIRMDGYKLIQRDQVGEELFDLQADPGEQRNLIDQEDRRAARLRAALAERCRRLVSAELGGESVEEEVEQMDDEVVERLRGLGYLT